VAAGRAISGPMELCVAATREGSERERVEARLVELTEEKASGAMGSRGRRVHGVGGRCSTRWRTRHRSQLTSWIGIGTKAWSSPEAHAATGGEGATTGRRHRGGSGLATAW
jgi:hypothetical protein